MVCNCPSMSKTFVLFIAFLVYVSPDSLYHIILSFSASLSELDPPEHLFRIRLVCVLLDTCGQYFDRGSSRKKLDCFLIYFQVSVEINISLGDSSQLSF